MPIAANVGQMNYPHLLPHTMVTSYANGTVMLQGRAVQRDLEHFVQRVQETLNDSESRGADAEWENGRQQLVHGA